jgi:hypothetical protein
MRSKEDIEKERHIEQSQYWNTRLILEVLLDIRELLQHEATPSIRQQVENLK